MIYVVIFMGILLIVAGVIIIRLKRIPPPVVIISEPEEKRADITIEDVIRLVNAGNFVDITTLMSDCGVEKTMPEFYAKYQARNKVGREIYSKELVAVLSKNKREQLEKLTEPQSGFSTMEILLLLLCEMDLDNKTIARVMGLGLETLKKRKTRLKIKIRDKIPELDVKLRED